MELSEPLEGWLVASQRIIDYQHEAFFSIAYNAAVFRERYLTNFYTIGQHAVTRSSGQPYAWIIPRRTDRSRRHPRAS